MVRANHLSLSAGLGIDLSLRMLCSSSYGSDTWSALAPAATSVQGPTGRGAGGPCGAGPSVSGEGARPGLIIVPPGTSTIRGGAALIVGIGGDIRNLSNSLMGARFSLSLKFAISVL